MNNPLYYIGDSLGGSKVEFPGGKEKILHAEVEDSGPQEWVWHEPPALFRQ